MLQKIHAALSPLAGGQQPMPPERLDWLTTRVNLFFGSFRKADADDPETFHAGCTRLFSAYPQEVVDFVIDPVTGLSGCVEWLPPLARVKQALDERAGQLGSYDQRKAQIDKQLADRKRVDHGPPVDLQAKYGPNWGLKGVDDKESPEQKQKRLSMLKEANWRAFARECEEAGISTDSPISPSLIKFMQSRR